MIRITSETQLLETFRPIDRGHVQIPADLKFPFLIRDSVSWVESSGHRTYLIFHDETTQRPLGIVFERAKTTAETPASMCQWCHSVHTGGGVTLLTAAVNRDHRIGAYLCSDLKCQDHVRSTPTVNDLNESLSREERVSRVKQKMIEFARRNLF